MFYSQFGEDKILFKLFNKKSKGVCVDIGANDGINDSNSMFFEKIGWQCILVEPNPDLCRQIRTARSSQLHECAASEQHSTVTLYIAEGAERAHGVSTICDTEEAKNKILSYGFVPRPVQVESKTLDMILEESKINSNIDFISIDVEGYELGVLKGFSIGKWLPTIIIIEDNHCFKDKTVKDYMEIHGYIAFMRTGVNDWYAHRTNNDFIKWRNLMLYKSIALKIKITTFLKSFPLITTLKRLLTGA
jgi:FkbM family methyltransferase